MQTSPRPRPRVIFGVLILVALSTTRAFAAIAGVPKLTDVAIYRAVHFPRHALLVGRGVADDRPYVVEFKSRDVGNVELVEGARPDAPAFEFADGRWFVRPPEFGATLAVDDDVPAGLIDPSVGRSEFTAIDVTSTVLGALGVTDLVADDVVARAQERDQRAADGPPDAADDRVSFVRAVAPQPDFEVLPELVADFRARRIGVPRATERALPDGRALWSVWALDGHVGHVVDFLRARPDPTVSVETRALQSRAVKREVATFFTDAERQLDRGQKTDADLATIIIDRIAAIEDLRGEHVIVRREMTQWQNARRATEALNTGFVRPLGQLVARGYELLHRLNTPAARDLVTSTNGPVGSRLHLLNRTADAAGATYFAHWLNRLRQRVTWVRTGDEATVRRQGARVFRGSGLRKYALSPVLLYDYAPADRPTEPPTTFPLRVFGMRDSPRQRAAFIKLVLEGDKAAEYARRALVDPAHADAPHVGLWALSQLISSLPFEVGAHRADPGTPFIAFDRALYFSQIAQILTELLITAPMTLINSATLLAVVDAGLTLPDQVKLHLDPKATRGLPQLTRELVALSAALHTWTLQMAYPNENVGLGGCNDDLAIAGNPS